MTIKSNGIDNYGDKKQKGHTCKTEESRATMFNSNINDNQVEQQQQQQRQPCRTTTTTTTPNNSIWTTM